MDNYELSFKIYPSVLELTKKNVFEETCYEKITSCIIVVSYSNSIC